MVTYIFFPFCGLKVPRLGKCYSLVQLNYIKGDQAAIQINVWSIQI